MAFDNIKPTLLGKRYLVYTALAGMGEATNAEVARKLGWSINRVTPRMLELRKEGGVTSAGRRNCKVTGNQAYTWRAR